MSESLRNPQASPADHAYAILQDHGPNDGGWGPAAVSIGGLPATPIIYTGSDTVAVQALHEAVRTLAERTGKPTRLALYRSRQDVLIVDGAG